MLIFLLVLTWFPVSAFAAVDWDALVDQNGGSRVHFGLALGGSQPFSRNQDELLAPASNSKLFTAGAALALLGPDFRYPTLLHWIEPDASTAERLELVGSGDPSWGMSEFGETLTSRIDSIVLMLKDAGVQTVAGSITVRGADPRWENLNFPVGWKAEDSLSCGGALAQSFNLDVNCETYLVSSPTKGAWQSPGLSFPVDLTIQTGSSTSLSPKLAVAKDGSFKFVISGTWKKGSNAVPFTLPIYDTTPWIAALFEQSLASHGISRTGGKPGTPGASRTLVSYSPPLSTLLKPFLKNSINFMGDAFLKSLAAQDERADDLLSAGLLALENYLNSLGLPRDFQLYDGSGLSRLSRVSPRFLLEFLSRQQREPAFPALWNALAIAGVDGTLSNRMKGTAAEGVLHAKTGTLDGVYNLAGYVPHGRDYVPFVILSRTTTSESSTARASSDRVGAKLAALYSKDSLRMDAGDEAIPYLPEHAGLDAQ